MTPAPIPNGPAPLPAGVRSQFRIDATTTVAGEMHITCGGRGALLFDREEWEEIAIHITELIMALVEEYRERGAMPPPTHTVN